MAPKPKAEEAMEEEEVVAEEDEDAEMMDEAKEEAKEDWSSYQEKKEPNEKPKEPEKPSEQEEDSPEDSRPKVAAGSVGINMADATLNVMPTSHGKLLMTLTGGGCQYLLAGARSTTGFKSGRYMFEVKIIESLNIGEAQGGGSRAPTPRQLVRVGFSLGNTSVLLADGPDNVCFDSEGYLVHEKHRKKVSQKFTKDHTVAVLLNLDPASPNMHTISCFRNGVRISDPQVIPECLQGKALFPTVTYKNVTLQVNFGPKPLSKLPFECRMLADAAAADAETLPPPNLAGKCEVVLPVGLPDQGYFDWVDDFMAKHPGYTELSDRKILEWACKSGIWRPKSGGSGSNDKPDMKFGIPSLDDLSISKVIGAIAPMQKRNFLIPELKSNLVPTSRKDALRKFPCSDYRRSAMVVMGEPKPEYKEKVQQLLLADKQAKAEAAKKKKATSLLKKKKEEVEKEAEEGEEKKEQDEGKEGDANEDGAVELTEEEKKLWYRKLATPDLTEKACASSYANFAIPSKDEGFDEVTFAWQPASKCESLLKEYIMEKKLTQKVEELQPGQEFKDGWQKWQKTLQEWRKKQKEWKDPAKKKAILAKKKEKKESGEEAAEVDMEMSAEDVEVSTVEDVSDIGNGEPLFANFVYEDWALLSARFELHMLVYSFKKDLADPDRPSFPKAHLPFYYNKYFKKPFNVKYFGVDKLADFVDMIKECISINEKSSFLEPKLPEETPHGKFVKLVEEHRRERQQRIDAGDETAQLKFLCPAPPPPRAPTATPPATGPPPSARGSAGAARSGSYGATQSSSVYSGQGQKRSYPTASGGASGYGSASKAPRQTYGGGAYYKR